jgi:hypothetical protein
MDSGVTVLKSVNIMYKIDSMGKSMILESEVKDFDTYWEEGIYDLYCTREGRRGFIELVEFKLSTGSESETFKTSNMIRTSNCADVIKVSSSLVVLGCRQTGEILVFNR